MASRRLIGLACFLHLECVAGFTSGNPLTFLGSRIAARAASVSKLQSSENFYNDFDDESIDAGNSNDKDEDDDDDDDDYIDSEGLGDWRTFRMNLAVTGNPTDKKPKGVPRKSVSKENEEVLRSQSKVLADEYANGMWAHDTAKPEVGGLVVRLPLEVELYRNTKHSLLGKKLRKDVEEGDRVALWYRKAQILCEKEMRRISETARGGQIDASKLTEESTEFLQMYLHNQETWQEVCLVIDRDERTGKASALVLNRPMAFKLTGHLAQLVLQGAFARANKAKYGPYPDLDQFMKAFGNECAVYVGGPDEQDSPATIIHGFRELAGAKEISPGANIYTGGIDAAIEGVIAGKYKALDFRFFAGRHVFENNTLELECLLGKYQPIACARSLALKQCISLPKPLWHEVLELCGGELKMISQLELLKRDDLTIEFDLDDADDEDDILDVFDELGELSKFDDDDDEEDDDDDFVI